MSTPAFTHGPVSNHPPRELELTPGDPTQTIHFKVAVGFNQVLAYVGSSGSSWPTRQELAEQAWSDDPRTGANT